MSYKIPHTWEEGGEDGILGLLFDYRCFERKGRGYKMSWSLYYN